MSDPRHCSSEVAIEEAAFELYAAGPWGEFYAFADGGMRAITDAHSMDVYRRMAQLVAERFGNKAPGDEPMPEHPRQSDSEPTIEDLAVHLRNHPDGDQWFDLAADALFAHQTAARRLVTAYMADDDLAPAVAALEDLTGGQQS